MRNFGPTHLAALAVFAILTLVVLVAVRRWPGRWVGLAARTLAVILVANELVWWYVLIVRHEWGWNFALPLYLCDAAGFVAAAALWSRRPLLVEVTYFWGLAGTFQALLTPELHDDYPSYFYFQFWIQHFAIVLAALFLVVGLRLRPRPGSVVRLVAITAAFTVVAGLADIVTGGNYMYLHNKPPGGSLLDLLGPWPVYIAGGVPLAVALLVLLDLPFWRDRRRAPAV